MAARALYMWAKHEWPQRALTMQGFLLKQTDPEAEEDKFIFR
jgi:hypothetical protein